MPGAILRPHSILTYSPRARPVSARLVFESSRWLRHQHTEESGFLGPSMVATSSNRAFVAGRTTVLIGPGYARPSPGKRARPTAASPSLSPDLSRLPASPGPGSPDRPWPG